LVQPSSLEQPCFSLQTMPSSQSCSPVSVPLSRSAAPSPSPTVLHRRPSGGAVSPVPPGATQPVDVIVMDHEMPVMTGSVATSRLRQLGVSCAIIGATGNALSKDKDAFKACGLNEIFTKPVNVCALTAWIRAHLATLPLPSAPVVSAEASAGAGCSPCGSPRAVRREQPEASLRTTAGARASVGMQPAGTLVNESASSLVGKATLAQLLQASSPS
jgi:CheY-like chemotaxis protein